MEILHRGVCIRNSPDKQRVNDSTRSFIYMQSRPGGIKREFSLQRARLRTDRAAASGDGTGRADHRHGRDARRRQRRQHRRPGPAAAGADDPGRRRDSPAGWQNRGARDGGPLPRRDRRRDLRGTRHPHGAAVSGQARAAIPRTHSLHRVQNRRRDQHQSGRVHKFRLTYVHEEAGASRGEKRVGCRGRKSAKALVKRGSRQHSFESTLMTLTRYIAFQEHF